MKSGLSSAHDAFCSTEWHKLDLYVQDAYHDIPTGNWKKPQTQKTSNIQG